MRDKQELYSEFNELVNMSPSELEEWLSTDDSQSVGQDSGDGEAIGHKSGEKIVAIKRKKKDELTDEDYEHMQKVISYISRHSAQRPSGDITDTRWHYSLKNWGPRHDRRIRGFLHGAKERDLYLLVCVEAGWVLMRVINFKNLFYVNPKPNSPFLYIQLYAFPSPNCRRFSPCHLQPHREGYFGFLSVGPTIICTMIESLAYANTDATKTR